MFLEIRVSYIKVRHAGLFEVVPQSSGDDVHRDVMSDHPTDAGHGGLRDTSIDQSLETSQVITPVTHSLNITPSMPSEFGLTRTVGFEIESQVRPASCRF